MSSVWQLRWRTSSCRLCKDFVENWKGRAKNKQLSSRLTCWLLVNSPLLCPLLYCGKWATISFCCLGYMFWNFGNVTMQQWQWAPHPQNKKKNQTNKKQTNVWINRLALSTCLPAPQHIGGAIHKGCVYNMARWQSQESNLRSVEDWAMLSLDLVWIVQWTVF